MVFHLRSESVRRRKHLLPFQITKKEEGGKGWGGQSNISEFNFNQFSEVSRVTMMLILNLLLFLNIM